MRPSGFFSWSHLRFLRPPHNNALLRMCNLVKRPVGIWFQRYLFPQGIDHNSLGCNSNSGPNASDIQFSRYLVCASMVYWLVHFASIVPARSQNLSYFWHETKERPALMIAFLPVFVHTYNAGLSIAYIYCYTTFLCGQNCYKKVTFRTESYKKYPFWSIKSDGTSSLCLPVATLVFPPPPTHTQPAPPPSLDPTSMYGTI
jgi:hypothetical protein